MSLASTSIGHSVSTFLEAAGQFFSDLAAVHWGALVLGLAFFALNLTLRSRAFFNSLRAAYPAVSFQWRRIWGAYWAAVGFNNVVPARGGDIIKLFLTRSSIPGSTYPTVASAFFVESIFDASVGVLVLIFAFTQGVFPKPPDFSQLSSFDISYLAEHFRFTLFLITALAILGLVAFALLSVRVQAFWERVRQGLTILCDRPRYLREVAALQAAGVGVPLRRLLVPARRLPRRRLGGERAARVRRQPGRGRGAVHAGRRRRAAGAAGEGVRHERRRHGGGGRLLGRSADRDRDLHRAGGAGRGRVHLPLPLLPRGDRRRARLARGRAPAERAGVLLLDDEPPAKLRARLAHERERATEAPRAPRARV